MASSPRQLESRNAYTCGLESRTPRKKRPVFSAISAPFDELVNHTLSLDLNGNSKLLVFQHERVLAKKKDITAVLHFLIGLSHFLVFWTTVETLEKIIE